MKQLSQNQQLGFDGLLQEAEADNEARLFARKTAHLPGTMSVGIPFYRRLIEQHHAAMLVGDVAETKRLRAEARLLAVKLNKGQLGILADDDAPGCVLARETGADDGTVPLWGQTGRFTIHAAGMAVRIDMEGLFGIGSGWGFWPGFAAHAVDFDKPFLSETGYRSFLGTHAAPQAGLTPESFARMVIEIYVAQECGGQLYAISERYRQRDRQNE